MQPAAPRLLNRAFLPVCLAFSLAVLVSPLWAAATVTSNSARLLRAEMPAAFTLDDAPCDLLSHALYRTVLAHRQQAAAILTTALTGDHPNGQPRLARPCACVRKLFHAAVVAAPSQAAVLMEQAVSLYPDCAAELQREASTMSDKNVVADYKDGAPKTNAEGAKKSGDDVFDPSFRDGVPPLADRDNGPSGFQTPGDYYGGFGVGFGPGFPGSPGFTGSTPSGANALPPLPMAVTSVVNQ